MTKLFTRIDVDGMVVEIRPIEREVHYTYSDGTPHYRQKSLYALYADDVLRGWVEFPLGWGGFWTLYSLRPQHERFEPNFHKHDEQERTQYGRAGYYRVMTPGALNETENWGPHKNRWASRNEILENVPALIKLGRLPTEHEMVDRLEAWKEQYAENKRREEARQAQWAQEREDRRIREQKEAVEREERRQETLEGLISLRTNFGARLSNLEALALSRAIERFEK